MSKVNVFTICPRPDCDGALTYAVEGVTCAKGHRFDHYAHGGLLEVGPELHRGRAIYVDPDRFLLLMDREARLWNAFVNFSADNNKFRGKLLDIAIELRDAAKDGRHNETQMDFEVDRMRAAGWQSYEGLT